MKLADLVRLQNHFGVSAPAFAWWAAMAALVSVAVVLLWLAIRVAVLSSRLKRATRRYLPRGAYYWKRYYPTWGPKPVDLDFFFGRR
jgi:hypothetical protein